MWKSGSQDGGLVSRVGGGPFSAGSTLLTLLLLTWLLRIFCFRPCRYYLDMHVIEMGTPPLVKTAARLFRELCYSNKSQLMAGIICAGWDSAKGGQVRARGWSIVVVSFGARLRAGGVISNFCRLVETPQGSMPTSFPFCGHHLTFSVVFVSAYRAILFIVHAPRGVLLFP